MSEKTSQQNKNQQDLAVVILAAGKGTRMRSSLPKVLHKAAGRSLLGYMINIAKKLEPSHIVVVVGYQAESVKEEFSADTSLTFVMQHEQLGTGHALQQAESALAGFQGDILLLNGDGPLLLKEETLRQLQATKEPEGMAVVTCQAQNPTGWGRIVYQADGQVLGIVEEKDSTPEQRVINEVNTGIFLFDSNVFDYAGQISSNNSQSEYYVTDLVEIYREQGKSVHAHKGSDEVELLHCLVNNRQQLAAIEGLLYKLIRQRWQEHGTIMLVPETIFIDDTVTIGEDVKLYPHVCLFGKTQVGDDTTIYPQVVLEHVKVLAHSEVCVVQEHSIEKKKSSFLIE